MSMKIANRNSMVLVRARNARLAKTRAYTHNARKYKKTTGSSNSAKYGNLFQTLSAIRQQSTDSSKVQQIASATKLSYGYTVMEDAAERLDTQLTKLLSKENESLFEGDGTEAQKEVSRFVNNYNIVMGRLNDAGTTADKNYAKKLQNEFSAYSSDLKKIGITQGKNGTLSVDETALKNAKAEDIKTVFGADAVFAQKTQATLKQITTYAKGKIQTLEKQIYSASANYNRYGMTTESSASIYNRRG